MAKKLQQVLDEDFLPRFEDIAAAKAELEEISEPIADLREHVEKYPSSATRARLARQLNRYAEQQMLLGETEGVQEALEQARALFGENDAPNLVLLADARLAWFQVLKREPKEAVYALQAALEIEDVLIRAWEDKLCLWLAAAHVALNQEAQAKEVLMRAATMLQEQPKRDRSLIRAALEKLGVTGVLDD